MGLAQQRERCRGSALIHFKRALAEVARKNHITKIATLLVIYKRPPKNERFPSRHAREEALCFGWIDGWYKRLDDERWVIRYSPRRKGSNWSKYNIARAWKLMNEGKMTPRGVRGSPLMSSESGRDTGLQ